MNTTSVARKLYDYGLSEDIKRHAAKGPVITPDYVVLRREDIPRLADEIDEFDRQLAAEAVERAKSPQEGPSLEKMQRNMVSGNTRRFSRQARPNNLRDLAKDNESLTTI